MDGSGFRGLGGAIRVLAWFGAFGMVCAAALAVWGMWFVIWFVLNHIQIV